MHAHKYTARNRLAIMGFDLSLDACVVVAWRSHAVWVTIKDAHLVANPLVVFVADKLDLFVLS